MLFELREDTMMTIKTLRILLLLILMTQVLLANETAEAEIFDEYKNTVKQQTVTHEDTKKGTLKEKENDIDHKKRPPYGAFNLGYGSSRAHTNDTYDTPITLESGTAAFIEGLIGFPLDDALSLELRLNLFQKSHIENIYIEDYGDLELDYRRSLLIIAPTLAYTFESSFTIFGGAYFGNELSSKYHIDALNESLDVESKSQTHGFVIGAEKHFYNTKSSVYTLGIRYDKDLSSFSKTSDIYHHTISLYLGLGGKR